MYWLLNIKVWLVQYPFISYLLFLLVIIISPITKFIIYRLILLINNTKDIHLVSSLDKVRSLDMVIICIWFLLRLIENVETKLIQNKCAFANAKAWV